MRNVFSRQQKSLSHGKSMGQTENTSLRYHPHWRKNAHFARTVMRSAGITAAAAVGYYSPSGFLPALVSPFTARSAAALSPIRGSLKVSCAITPLTQRFLKYGVIVSPFLQMSSKNFIGRRLFAQHFQQLRGGVRDVFRAGNFQFLAAAEAPADGDQRQTGVAGRGHIHLAVAHIHGIFRADAES